MINATHNTGAEKMTAETIWNALDAQTKAEYITCVADAETTKEEQTADAIQLAWNDSPEGKAENAETTKAAQKIRSSRINQELALELAAWNRGNARVNGDEYPLNECPRSICRIAEKNANKARALGL